MAKPSKKKPVARKSGKKAAKGKSGGELTILAVALMALTMFWTLGAGSLAIVDIFSRRADCQAWLVEAGRGQSGYRRVYDEQATKFGCSITKLGLKGYMAERPIYPNVKWLLIVFGMPTGLMAFYFAVLKLKRSWILGRKKKIWALAGPLDFDDFEDTREFPDADADEVLDEDAAGVEAAAAPDDAPAADQAAGEPSQRKAKQAEGAGKTADEPEPAEEPEEPEELSELDKILRQVDDD